MSHTKAPAPTTHGELAARFETVFGEWAAEPRRWPDEEFEIRALAAFTLQYRANRPYARYCTAVGRTPETVDTWLDIPPVPTAAFRTVELIVGEPSDAELTFRTSGTTGGTAARGTHLVRRSATYRAALTGPFRHAVLGGRSRSHLLLLHPPFAATRDSSLAWMFDVVFEEMGTPESRRIEPGADEAAMAAAIMLLEQAASDGEPVTVLGTTLALADWSERLDPGLRIPLASESRIMDTGGTKGRGDLERDAVIGGLLERFTLEPDAAVNEFGMTELLSQRYGRGLGRIELRGPPWLRSRVLDPVTLEERAAGDEGILCHYDLANVGSVVAVLTADRGRAVGGAIEWLGRTPGATPRGCSLATAELLEAQD